MIVIRPEDIPPEAVPGSPRGDSLLVITPSEVDRMARKPPSVTKSLGRDLAFFGIGGGAALGVVLFLIGYPAVLLGVAFGYVTTVQIKKRGSAISPTILKGIVAIPVTVGLLIGEICFALRWTLNDPSQLLALILLTLLGVWIGWRISVPITPVPPVAASPTAIEPLMPSSSVDLPEPTTPMDPVGAARESFPACPICDVSISEGQMKKCDQCETPYHQECWNYNGGCATLGCVNNPKTKR